MEKLALGGEINEIGDATCETVSGNTGACYTHQVLLFNRLVHVQLP